MGNWEEFDLDAYHVKGKLEQEESEAPLQNLSTLVICLYFNLMALQDLNLVSSAMRGDFI